MTNLISFVQTNLNNFWILITEYWILSSVVIISILNLIATLVIHTMGNKK